MIRSFEERHPLRLHVVEREPAKCWDEPGVEKERECSFILSPFDIKYI